ncbi:serine/threonine-protein phosphatase 6 regulatory ankyrin repeat subunit B-like isoform X1 [Biomphalaria glabrata]|uniref:Serine/threonine-protein phosphatase 6 regulatory ankyrin repeat subunit B-like isoform X1 n=2 Tax=Biomphalaria glabrata TaxID=6526 RepID=A0A9W3BBP8_BIOGL|nr:serine/threonine-protein phosphatase 6 regulatory ankyrin repeat subunit B-like isoform X1 [Biomphalaria glabrata]XP_055896870.1 serine/threonine-protein phosphatase 6 regulatory ankyrin repeat subunit B-like isoform X1 [Biomphalaria glabrata]XP_055896871.1 serine/threonine-protein phosphatase 6 regulatory ankyrin repeat subunit B-like isoform X1 [Biomphalaria glabrata]XP_055896872.1 serine/threonine-protein phosphatase 6 regulatory ankyrin repeat subunit B-like isoform X1 [Biomphalaria glabr
MMQDLSNMKHMLSSFKDMLKKENKFKTEMAAAGDSEDAQKEKMMEIFIKSMEGEHMSIIDSLLKTKLRDKRLPLDVNQCVIEASIRGNLVVLTKLLNLHPRLSHGDDENRRAIHYAAMNGHLGCVKLLLKSGASSNCSDDDGRTPLHYACSNGHLDIVKTLVTQGSSVNSCRTEIGECALHVTAATDHVNIMEVLLDNGGDVNNMTRKLKGGSTPLHIAITSDKPDMVDYLCRHGALLNMEDGFGKFPIHIACEKGVVRCIPVLIQHGADLEMLDSYNQTPLCSAALENQPAVAKLLIEHGANVHSVDNNGFTPLHKASIKGNVELIDHLMSAGADLNKRSTKSLQTPLMTAVYFGKLEAIKRLVHYGADTTVTDINGQTPLHLVHSKIGGDPIDKILLALLEGGGRLDIRDQNHFTPLQKGIYTGVVRSNLSLPSIQLLVQAGSLLAPDKYTSGKNSPLFWLAYSGCLKEAAYLVRAGWDLNNETWIMLPGKDSMQDKLHDFMIVNFRTVPSLLHRTRQVIRSHLSSIRKFREILSSIDSLPIPSALKSYLKLEDVDPNNMDFLDWEDAGPYDEDEDESDS